MGLVSYLPITYIPCICPLLLRCLVRTKESTYYNHIKYWRTSILKYNKKKMVHVPCLQAKTEATVWGPSHGLPNTEQVTDPFPYRWKVFEQTSILKRTFTKGSRCSNPQNNRQEWWSNILVDNAVSLDTIYMHTCCW